MGWVWRVDAAALPLAESLLEAYRTTQVKLIKERQRRAACAVRLTKFITTGRSAYPDAVSLYVACKLEVEKERAAASAAAQRGTGANTDAQEDTGGERARPPNSRRRKRGQARKGNVKPGDEPALNIPRPLLQQYMQVLDANDVDHICRMGLAFTLDPVVARIKVRHLGGLEDLCNVLRSGSPRHGIEMVVGMATSRDCERAAKSRSVICLLELRHIMVALQAAALLFETKPAFAGAIADVFYDAVSCARSFYSDFAGEVKDRHEFMARYLDNDDATDEQMVAYIKERYCGASTSTSATGVYTPGRDKCRAEPFDKGDKTSCGTCEKGYNSSEKYWDGALTLCCACAHLKILDIVVLDRKESRQVLINALLIRLPLLPRYLVYDFACGVVR